MRNDQSGLALKPILVLLVVLGGMGFYMLKDLQKIKTPAKKVSATKPGAATEASDLSSSTASSAPPAPVATATGQVCGVSRYQCTGSTSAQNPTYVPGPALKLEGVLCPGQDDRPLNCAFVDLSQGFKLDGTSCAPGSVPVMHPGHLRIDEQGDGESRTATFQQTILVLCVKP